MTSQAEITEQRRFSLREMVEAYLAGLNDGRSGRQPTAAVLSATPQIMDIQKIVAREFGLDTGAMKSACRSRHQARPRQIAMYLCRELTPHSYPIIGRHFGGRDHTTVLHAVKAITRLCLYDSAFKERVDSLRDICSGKHL